MSEAAAGHAAHEQAHGHGESFIDKYIFSTDHKMIAKQFLWYGLIMMIFGGLFAMMVRWQLAAETAPAETSELTIFTTRPDTLFGASFLAVAADHPLAAKAAETDPALQAFIEECRRTGTSAEALETAEKKGYRTPIMAVHPFDPEWKLPVYVANFVLMEYGTGAIFGCPAHDQRDLDFARKYDLPVTPVVLPPKEDPTAFSIYSSVLMPAAVSAISTHTFIGTEMAGVFRPPIARVSSPTQHRDASPPISTTMARPTSPLPTTRSGATTGVSHGSCGTVLRGSALIG